MAPGIVFPTPENEQAVLGVLVIDKTNSAINDYECGCDCDCGGTCWLIKVTNN